MLSPGTVNPRILVEGRCQLFARNETAVALTEREDLEGQTVVSLPLLPNLWKCLSTEASARVVSVQPDMV